MTKRVRECVRASLLRDSAACARVCVCVCVCVFVCVCELLLHFVFFLPPPRNQAMVRVRVCVHVCVRERVSE